MYINVQNKKVSISRTVCFTLRIIIYSKAQILKTSLN